MVGDGYVQGLVLAVVIVRAPDNFLTLHTQRVRFKIDLEACMVLSDSIVENETLLVFASKLLCIHSKQLGQNRDPDVSPNA